MSFSFNEAAFKKAISGAVNDVFQKNRERLDAIQAARVEAVASHVTDVPYPKDTAGNSFLVDNPPFTACSGGMRVMHYLPALLAEAGYAVATTRLCYFNPLIPVRPLPLENDIVISGEGQWVHVAGAKRVCRWVLCYTGKFCKERFGEKDCVIVYQREFLPSAQAVCDHPVTEEDVVFLPHLDPAWCFPGKKFVKNVVYGVEATNKRDVLVNPDLADAVFLPYEGIGFKDGQLHNSFFQHQRTLAFLRAAENFYTVDHNTAMSVEAQMCGCRVWYVNPDGTARRKKFSPEWVRQMVMRPDRDVAVADVFARRVLSFFS